MVRRQNKRKEPRPRYELPGPYEDIPESYWTGFVINVKYIISWHFPCSSCCSKSIECVKLCDIAEVQEDLV